MPTREYRPRLIDNTIDGLFAELPAVMLTGPRAGGKTTTAARHSASIARLDRPAEAAAFRADPDVALAELEEPALLDEWQEVPAVLGAVKRAVDSNPRAGRFLLTGSVRAELEAATWPGTGRLVRLPLYGMTIREQLGNTRRPSLLDRLAAGAATGSPADPLDLRGYVDFALKGGFPEAALHLSPGARERWLESYTEQLLTRDAIELDPRRDPVRLRRYFEALALNSAGIVSDTTLLRAASINRRTGVAYERLLSNLFVVEAVPAWASNRLRRLSRMPKRYLVDPALGAAALRVDARAVLRDGDLLGRLLDTFVVAQLRAELAVSEARPRCYHVREEHGRHEIDLVAEIGGQDLLAFEVKAAAAPGAEAARHLVWLRDRLGARFRAGIVFHTGPRAFELDERISAVPICALWG